MAGPRRYGSDVDIIPAKGGMGPGGIGAGNIEARAVRPIKPDPFSKEATIAEEAARDLRIAKSAPERKAALKGATTSTEDGVKVTKYPYVEPSIKRQNYQSLDDALQRIDDAGLKKGGTVKRSSASKRADGCAIRGRTRA